MGAAILLFFLDRQHASWPWYLTLLPGSWSRDARVNAGQGLLLESAYIYPPKLHQCRNCTHMRKLNSDVDHLVILYANTANLSDAVSCHHNACNPWLESWDVTIIYIEGAMTCVTAQWITVDHMTLCLAKWNLIWTAIFNSRVMIGESQTQS